MTEKQKKYPWYVGGLHFDCTGCGACCAGPDEGYIWITSAEIKMLAKHLGMTVEQVRAEYLARYGNRSSIIEEPESKDCMFLSPGCNRGCSIYPVRPNQCRTWPFWNSNLNTPYDWNLAGVKCPGINRGDLYTFEEIEVIRKQKKWWDDDDAK